MKLKMKEIEILVEISDDINKVLYIFNKFDYIDTSLVIDEYYYDPKRDNLKPNQNNNITECLRLRTKGNKNYITYKDDVFDNDIWLYSNEYETEVKDIEVLKKILNKLGLKKLITVKNNKKFYKYNTYEITLEDVEDLGYFMEVEYLANEDVDVKEIKKQIRDFIDSLGLNVKEANIGKPEMLLNKLNIKVEDE